MNEISVPCTIGNEVKQLKIEFMANGIGQIRMDKYYHGQAVFAQGQWQIFLNDKTELNNSDDIQALIQILTEQEEK